MQLNISNTRIPGIIVIVAISMGINFLPILIFMPSGTSALAWILPFVASISELFNARNKVNFPLKIWLPFIVIVFIYFLFSTASNALQRSIMLLVPIAVGCACSTLSISENLFFKIKKLIDKFTIIFMIISLYIVAATVVIDTDSSNGYAMGAITATLLTSWYMALSGYYNSIRYALIAGSTLIIPIISNVRIGMLAVVSAMIFTFSPIGFFRRMAIIGLLSISGFFIFHTDKVQQKMFFSGSGTILEAIDGAQDLFFNIEVDSQNFVTSGRVITYLVLKEKLDENYWFGHGSNSSEIVTLNATGVVHPHNDWLRLHFEYGLIGAIVFGLTMLVQSIDAFSKARKADGFPSIFLYAGATSFIPMAVTMLSDNVILYIAWFGILQFALLGLGYGSYHRYER